MIITETPRLRIEEIVLTDSGFFHELMNTPKWLSFIGDRGITSKKKAAEYIFTNYMSSYDLNGYGLYKVVLKEGNCPIGTCGLLKRDYLEHADIGFAILPAYEGKGYIVEASEAVLNYGMNTLGLNKILGITTGANIVSQKLLQKIGLQYIGTVNAPNQDTPFLMFSNE